MQLKIKNMLFVIRQCEYNNTREIVFNPDWFSEYVVMAITYAIHTKVLLRYNIVQ